MKVPVSTTFAAIILFVLGIIIAAMILFVVYFQFENVVTVGDTYEEYGNTRNIEYSTPYVIQILFTVGVLFTLVLFSDRIKIFLKKKLKK